MVMTVACRSVRDELRRAEPDVGAGAVPGEAQRAPAADLRRGEEVPPAGGRGRQAGAGHPLVRLQIPVPRCCLVPVSPFTDQLLLF